MKNEYKINKQEMMSWAREYHLHGAVNIILFTLWCLVGVIGLALLVFLIANGGDWINWYFSILFTALAIYKLVFSRYVVYAKRYKIYSKTYGVSEWTRTTEFADDEIVLTDHTSVTKLRYENIKKIKEKGRVVMIFMNHNLAFRIYKDTFTEGSWEACREKIGNHRQ